MFTYLLTLLAFRIAESFYFYGNHALQVPIPHSGNQREGL